MPARIDVLADLIAARIQTLIDDTEAAIDPVVATVQVVDMPEVDSKLLLERQRKVFVVGLGYEDRGNPSRGTNSKACRFGILIVEKFVGDSGMTLAWRRERTAWVESTLFATFGDSTLTLDGAYPENIQVSEDPEERLERLLFWSDIELVLVDD